MSRLAEIEKAAAVLPTQQKRELILFVAARLHADGGVLPPSRYSGKERMPAWIAEDEAGMRQFRKSA
jgi:hypothetical protein